MRTTQKFSKSTKCGLISLYVLFQSILPSVFNYLSIISRLFLSASVHLLWIYTDNSYCTTEFVEMRLWLLFIPQREKESRHIEYCWLQNVHIQTIINSIYMQKITAPPMMRSHDTKKNMIPKLIRCVDKTT